MGGEKLNVSFVFITQFYFAVPKNIILNSTHYFVMESPNNLELRQIASTNSLDIDFKDFTNLDEKCPAKPYSFLLFNATLASDNPLRFRKKLAERR